MGSPEPQFKSDMEEELAMSHDFKAFFMQIGDYSIPSNLFSTSTSEAIRQRPLFLLHGTSEFSTLYYYYFPRKKCFYGPDYHFICVCPSEYCYPPTYKGRKDSCKTSKGYHKIDREQNTNEEIHYDGEMQGVKTLLLLSVLVIRSRRHHYLNTIQLKLVIYWLL